jgi:hypothetical protein
MFRSISDHYQVIKNLTKNNRVMANVLPKLAYYCQHHNMVKHILIKYGKLSNVWCKNNVVQCISLCSIIK